MAKTFVYALGGLNEVGKNTYCIEHNGSIVIIDAGVKFAESELPGVDYIIPDYTFLVQNSKKIKALIITHGHEDHIGGIPFILQYVHIPLIYAPKLAAGLIRNKFEEFDVNPSTKLVEISSDDVLNIGEMKISFFNTTHSIPDSLGICIDTPNGRIIETGDFKIDLTPIGKDIEFSKITRLGEEGVDLYMADSTNAEVEGFSKSERDVAKSLKEVFKAATGRIIIATFASNVHRIQQIIENALKYNRKILVFGRSMQNAIVTGRKLGYIHCPDDYIFDMENDKISPYTNLNEILILCTGSQGEPLAALSRIANNTHKLIRIIPGDTVVFSSNPIPGNLAPVTRVINMLAKQGAEVIVNSALYSIHTSGHGQREELKLMLKLFSPRNFMPIHGDYRMLKLHGDLSISMGVTTPETTFICSNGDCLVLDKGVVSRGEPVQAGVTYIDGREAIGLNSKTILERRGLGNDGLIAVVCMFEENMSSLLKPPSIVSRGFIYLKTYGEILLDAEKVLNDLLTNELKKGLNEEKVKSFIIEETTKYIFEKTQRKPIILPCILRKDSN